MKKNSISIKAVKVLRLRYLLAITIIAILVVASHLMLDFSNRKAKFDSRLINIAGRQRMLSQKITKCVFGLTIEKNSLDRELYLKELKESLQLWEKSHNGLINGDDSLGVPGKNSEEILELFEKLDKSFTEIKKNIDELIQLTQNSSSNNDQLELLLKNIRKNEQEFLPLMDQIVFQYDLEANKKIQFTKNISIYLGIITLFILFLEALFIFKPLENKLSKTIENISSNEDNLRRLFDLAPQPLFLIDPDSYKIIRLNQKASEIIDLNFDLAIDKSISEFLEKSTMEKMNFIAEHQFNGKLENIETVLTDFKGNEKFMLLSASCLYYHNKNIFLIGITNISKQKEQELELNYFATVDEMTGLVNRRAGLAILEKEFNYAQKNQSNLSLIFIDIDNLKFTNDKFGHEKGDELIKNVSSAILKRIRNGDTAFRYGGDEIVVLLKSCNEEFAKIIVNRITSDLEGFNNRNEYPFRHEISYGVTQYREEEFENYSDFLDKGDKLMYINKTSKKS